MQQKLKELIETWQQRQVQYAEWAVDPEMSEHNRAKFTYKAMATRDCLKELNDLMKENG